MKASYSKTLTACSFYTLFMSTLGPLAVKSQLAACSTSWCNKWSGLREITITLQLFNFKPRGSGWPVCYETFWILFWVLVEEVHGVVKRLHDANDLIVPRKTMENLHDFQSNTPIFASVGSSSSLGRPIGMDTNDTTGVFLKEKMNIYKTTASFIFGGGSHFRVETFILSPSGGFV